eukprot:NODE_2617_length_905_cov_2.792941.p12 GENE.NODE_2617_length_905_cov_2.792941~~NODE_2617_length_905_cov_2.792941.p12  ORF type:complete len:53 (+),score=7.59 NODE_2617_length_905_cov_2.792941:216-374(+)
MPECTMVRVDPEMAWILPTERSNGLAQELQDLHGAARLQTEGGDCARWRPQQ